ncbi:MAG: phosphocholine cytidylyltransferase family protein [Syntrophobacterales bacterium]|nr:phosphocholine cytidylyltransferase family protein [Syntrophobacterales bacterium]
MKVERAIILAAGQGKRLLPYTKDRPKCLLQFGEKSLIEIQIEALRVCGIKDVTVVIGYRGDLVKGRLGDRAKYVENIRYEDTSSMYSLWLAGRNFSGSCVILNSDVLFHPSILKKLLDSKSPNALAMDFHSHLNEEEMKVLVEGKRVKGLSKAFRQADGENVGMLKFDENGWSLLFETIEDLLNQGYIGEMVPFAVNAIVSRCFIEAVSVDHLPWIEIDFPEDYERAQKEIYPAVTLALCRGSSV